MAAVHHLPNMQRLKSHFLALESIQDLPLDRISYPKSVYAGVKSRLLAKAPPRFSVVKVKGHEDPDSLEPGSEEWLDAVGNDHADRAAKQGAALHSLPSTSELSDHRTQSEVLGRWLQYAYRALELWPRLLSGPRRDLDKRDKAELACESGDRSYPEDLLGLIYRRNWGGGESCLGPSADAAAARCHFASGALSVLRPETETHAWRRRAGKWICNSCLGISHAVVPGRSVGCPGFSPRVREALHAGKGHKLMLAPFTDGNGLVVICAGCGPHMTTNRRCKLHTETCRPGFAGNPAAKAHWKRESDRMHPRHSEGDAKVLEPVIPWSSLAPAPHE